MEHNQLALNIRVNRTRARLTQEELADRLGLSQNVISKWERGDVMPRANQVILLARAMDCRLAELFEGCDLPRYGSPIETA
jgi:transcriptional regulator with XRE-family HTH domain